MTDRQYVIRACQMARVDLIPATRDNPGILGTHWYNGFGSNVIDAQNWADAKEQLNKWAMDRAQKS